jgi:hypothetical protein
VEPTRLQKERKAKEQLAEKHINRSWEKELEEVEIYCQRQEQWTLYIYIFRFRYKVIRNRKCNIRRIEIREILAGLEDWGVECPAL